MDSDYLTCGKCLKEYPLQSITLFIQHKKMDCDEDTGSQFEDTDLKCYYCPRGFMSAWGLLVHVQLTHSLQIFVERTSISLSTQSSQEQHNTRPKSILTSNILNNENTHTKKLEDCSTTKVISSVEDKGTPIDEESTGDTGTHQTLSINVGKGTSMEVTDTVKKENNHTVVTEKIMLHKRCFTSNGSIDSTAFAKETVLLTASPSNPSNKSSMSANVIPVQDSFHSVSDNSHIPTVQEIPKPPPLVSDIAGHPQHTEPTVSNIAVKDCKIPEVKDITEPENSSDVVEEPSDDDCCDNQGCGITIIPGSHQDLQKCCNAVVPKKRKRHMEMKHMPFSWSSSRYAKMRMLRRSLASATKAKSLSHTGQSAHGTIFIDVEPDTYSDINKQSTIPTQDTDNSMTDSYFDNVNRFPPGSEAKSLIIQPGAVVSIPFSYSLPSLVSGTSTSVPISIIQAQSDGPSSVTGKKLPVATYKKLNDHQVQKSLSGIEENIFEFRRRKYPTSKPFQCDICPMAFNQRIHLKKHTSKHTGIKPYKCDECDYSTVERSHLKVHIRIHTGEKPFKCTYCEYATAQNSTLKIHLKRHHGGKMFACDSCDKTFTQIEQLKGHESEHLQASTNSEKQKVCVDETKLNAEHERPIVDLETASEDPPCEDLGHVLSIPDTQHKQSAC